MKRQVSGYEQVGAAQATAWSSLVLTSGVGFTVIIIGYAAATQALVTTCLPSNDGDQAPVCMKAAQWPGSSRWRLRRLCTARCRASAEEVLSRAGVEPEPGSGSWSAR